MSTSANKKTTVAIVLVMLLAALCGILCTSSRAWFFTAASTEQTIKIEADGVVYISVPVTVDMIEDGEDDRILRPAVALPFALANGAPMDVTKTYAETQNTANVSYVSTAASQGVYKGEFHYTQAEGTASYIQFSLGHYINKDDSDTQLSIDEITIDEIIFYYNRSKLVRIKHLTDETGKQVEEEEYETVRVDALSYDENCTLSANKTSGRIYVADSQQVYFEIYMHLTYVDELVDSRLGQTDHFFTGISLVKSSLEATYVPDTPEHVYED